MRMFGDPPDDDEFPCLATNVSPEQAVWARKVLHIGLAFLASPDIDSALKKIAAEDGFEPKVST